MIPLSSSRTRRAWLGCLLALALRSVEAAPPSPSGSEGLFRIFNQLEPDAVVGSGTLVQRSGDVGVVLTCAHLFAEGEGELYLLAEGDKPRRAILLGRDDANDLACLAVRLRAGRVLPVAADLPSVDAPLSSCGFGQLGAFRANEGRMLGLTTLVGGLSQGVIEMSGAARQGDSGGPILNARRQVVGVIIGTDGETVDGTHCQRIRAFLAEHPLTADAARRAAEIAARPLPPRATAYTVGGVDAESPVLADNTQATVRGQVTWAKRPAGEMILKLEGRRQRQIQVDAQGRFEVRDLPSGVYRVRGEKVLRNTYRRADEELLVPQGADLLEVQVELR